MEQYKYLKTLHSWNLTGLLLLCFREQYFSLPWFPKPRWSSAAGRPRLWLSWQELVSAAVLAVAFAVYLKQGTGLTVSEIKVFLPTEKIIPSI